MALVRHVNDLRTRKKWHLFAKSILWATVFCCVLSPTACASVSPEDEVSTSIYTAIDSTDSVPLAGPSTGVGPTPDGSSPSAIPSTPAGSANVDLGVQLTSTGKSASVAGISLRWRGNTSRCMARQTMQPVIGDRIVMANCASDARQAFYKPPVGRTLRVAGGLCVGKADSSNDVVLIACGDASFPFMTIRWDGLFFQADIDKDIFAVESADDFGTLGKTLQFVKSYGYNNKRYWDAVGVGNAGGSLLLLNTTSSCLSRRGADLALNTCDGSDPAQRWRYDSGFLANDAGGCVACDYNSLACTIKTCDPSASKASSQFSCLLRNYLVFNGYTNGDLYQLSSSSATATPNLDKDYSNSFREWQFGSTLP